MLYSLNSCIDAPYLKPLDKHKPGRALNDNVAIVYSKHYQISMGGMEKLHSFDIHKYSKIYSELVSQGLLSPADIFVPEPVTQEETLLVHSTQMLENLRKSSLVAQYLELPIVKYLPRKFVDTGILKSFRHATGGTILAARLALEYGIAINIGGGFHHAKPHTGEGFCIYADMPIAIRALQQEKLIRRGLVIDLDVHQGNGTVVCCAGDENIFTFSMHQKDIYPLPKERSDFDIELRPGTEDETYLLLLRRSLPVIIRRAKPDIVFLQAGCDTLADDPLASLSMSIEGIVARDAMVIDECAERKIPVVMVLGGGYSREAWAAQHASIKRTIEKYSSVDPEP